MRSREAVCTILDALTTAHIPHMVTGGLVANAHGIPRSTHDADIVLQVEGNAFESFARALPPELQIDAQISFETITGSQRQIVSLRGSPFKIELFF